MSLYNVIYNTLILFAFLLSLITFLKGHKRFLILSILLLITSFVELLVLELIKKGLAFTWIYHLFNLLEYSLLSLFLMQSIKSPKIANAIKLSIPMFILVAFLISLFYYRFKNLPGININIEGLLLSVSCTYILLNLEIYRNQSILYCSNFWICLGILIFFGGTFFFNGIYRLIVNLDKTEALRLFSIINSPLNIILYSFIIIGILCLLPNKRYITR